MNPLPLAHKKPNERKASCKSTPVDSRCSSTIKESDNSVLMVTIQRNQDFSGGRSGFSQPEPSSEPRVPVTDDVADKPSYYRDLLYDVFEALRSASQGHQQELLQMIRHRTPMQQIRVFLNRILPDAEVHEKNEEEPSKLRKIRHDVRMENDMPQFRPQIMDIHYLCGSAPYRVPAKPWTSVTDDDDLMSHLVSLCMTWDYPFYAFFDRETLLEHMAKGIELGLLQSVHGQCTACKCMREYRGSLIASIAN